MFKIKYRDCNLFVKYILNGRYHRLDGPAIENPGGRFWFKNGERHREDGPAVEYKDGTREWYIEGHYRGCLK